MPTTFLRYFCIGATLRWKMAVHPWPKNHYFTEMLADLRNVFGYALANIPGISDTKQETQPSFMDFDKEKASPLHSDIYQALLLTLNLRTSLPYRDYAEEHHTESPSPVLYPEAQMLLQAEYQGVKYGCRGRRNDRNSYIMFHPPQLDAPTAGQIVKLFRHMRQVKGTNVSEDFCLVHAFEPLSSLHAQHDVWRLWPDIEASLYYERFVKGADGEPKIYVVSLKDVVSHCATYAYVPGGVEESCVLSISVGKVSCSPVIIIMRWL